MLKKILNVFCVICVFCACEKSNSEELGVGRQGDMQTLSLENDSVMFLKKINTFSIASIVSDKSVTSVFGWKALDVVEGKTARVTTFDTSRSGVIRYAHLYHYKATDSWWLSISLLPPNKLCMRGGDVVSVFGEGFKPTVTSLDPGFDLSSMTAEATRWFERFSNGPIYYIGGENNVSVRFGFYRDECLNTISVSQEKSSKRN